eukprot:9306604-Lingulodinium_polyedra.AAC.1
MTVVANSRQTGAGKGTERQTTANEHRARQTNGASTARGHPDTVRLAGRRTGARARGTRMRRARPR